MSKYTRGEFFKLGAAMSAGATLGQDRTAGGIGADLVLLGGKILTVEDRAPRAQAFAVKNGRFIAVGTDAQVRTLVVPGTEVIDAGGATVTPGFIDTHAHPASGGVRELLSVNADLRSIEEIKAALRARAARTPPGEWVVGFKYDDTKVVEGRRLTMQDLDDAVPDHPVMVVMLARTARNTP
jgi:predicted amidohydrolase YtcJ